MLNTSVSPILLQCSLLQCQYGKQEKCRSCGRGGERGGYSFEFIYSSVVTQLCVGAEQRSGAGTTSYSPTPSGNLIEVSVLTRGSVCMWVLTPLLLFAVPRNR